MFGISQQDITMRINKKVR